MSHFETDKPLRAAYCVHNCLNNYVQEHLLNLNVDNHTHIFSQLCSDTAEQPLARQTRVILYKVNCFRIPILIRTVKIALRQRVMRSE